MIPVVSKWYLFLFKIIPFFSLKRYLFKSKMMSFIFLNGKKVGFYSKVPFWNQNQQKLYLLSQNDTFFYSKLYLSSPLKGTFLNPKWYLLTFWKDKRSLFIQKRNLFEIKISKNDTCCPKMIPFFSLKRYLFKSKMMSFNFKKQPLFFEV